MRGRTATIIAIAIALLLSYGLVSRFLLAPHNAHLHRALDDRYIPHITFLGNMYEVTNEDVLRGERRATKLESFFVLRIAVLYSLARFDGIFAIDGTNPDSLTHSLDLFKESQKDYTFLYTDSEQEVITQRLHPFGFIQKLSETQAKRQAFIMAPSISSAITYYRSISNLLNVYEQGLLTARGLIEEEILPEKGFRYIFAFGATDGTEFVDALNQLLDQKAEAKTHVRDQVLCAFYYSDDCNPTIKYRNLIENIQSPIPDVDEELEKQIRQHRRIVSENKLSILGEPLGSYLIQSDPCSYYNPTYYFLGGGIINNGLRFIKMTSLNDLYFYDTSKFSKHPFTLLAKEKEEQGLLYASQSVTSNYMCPEIAYDLFRVNTYYYIKSFLTNWEIPPGLASNTQIQSLKDAIIEGDIVRETDILRLVSLLAESSSEKITPEDRKNIEDLLILTDQLSAQLELIIANLLVDNALVRPTAETEASAPIEHIIMGRGYYPFFFLVPNRTVSREYVPFMSKEPVDISSFKLVSWKDDLSKRVSEEFISEEYNKHVRFVQENISRVYTSPKASGSIDN